MRKIENMMLTVFLVVSLICGKYLLDYWQDSYDNRQNYRHSRNLGCAKEDVRAYVLDNEEGHHFCIGGKHKDFSKKVK